MYIQLFFLQCVNCGQVNPVCLLHREQQCSYLHTLLLYTVKRKKKDNLREGWTMVIVSSGICAQTNLPQLKQSLVVFVLKWANWTDHTVSQSLNQSTETATPLFLGYHYQLTYQARYMPYQSPKYKIYMPYQDLKSN